MKITKTAAEITAKQMTNDAMDATIKKSEKELKDFIKQKVEPQVPKEVLSVFRNEKYSPYFHSSSGFRISHNGTCDWYDYFYISDSLPTKLGHSTIDFNDEDYSQFKKLKIAWDKLKKQQESLESRIYNAILAFSTVKKLQEGFEEAYEAMPENFKIERVSTGVAVPVDDILKELNFYK